MHKVATNLIRMKSVLVQRIQKEQFPHGMISRLNFRFGCTIKSLDYNQITKEISFNLIVNVAIFIHIIVGKKLC